MLTAVVFLAATALFLAVLTLLLGVRLWIEIDATNRARADRHALTHENARLADDVNRLEAELEDYVEDARPITDVELPTMGVDLGKRGAE